MGDIHYVCQGAVCKCSFGSAPDKLVVKSHHKDYFNDEGIEKLAVTTKELGQTFENNSFGSCSKMNNSPCKVTLTGWLDPREKLTLSNGGKAILETSTATCPVGCPGCIRIVFHGQTMEVVNTNLTRGDDEFLAELNPFLNLKEFIYPGQDGFLEQTKE
jgi:hypothetical protein